MANILISRVRWNYVSQRWSRIHYVTEKSSHWSYVEQQLKARFKEKDDDFPYDEHHDFAENDLVNFYDKYFLTPQENSIALTQQMGQGIQEWTSKNCARQPLKKSNLVHSWIPWPRYYPPSIATAQNRARWKTGGLAKTLDPNIIIWMIIWKITT